MNIIFSYTHDTHLIRKKKNNASNIHYRDNYGKKKFWYAPFQTVKKNHVVSFLEDSQECGF